PNFAFAKRAAAPRQRLLPGVLREARSECSRPKSAPLSAGEASSFQVLPVQHLAQAPDFLGANALILEEVQDKLPVRVLEKAAHQVPNFRARCLLLPDQRRIYVRPSIL